VLLSLLGIHALLALVDESLRSVIAVTLLVVVATGCVGVGVAFAVTKLLPLSGFWQRLSSPSQATHIAILGMVFALAATTHLLNVLVFWILGQSLGLTMTFDQWFIVVPTVLLVSMLPISVGGWGVREGAMVVVLHGFGISAEDALLPSVLFGLCAVVATLPGGVLWIMNKEGGAKNLP
jgi:glycosyltransferase 2 family protein